ncbi:hypothetical protein IT403_03005 [Candidatus Nomurabacteria bacterium]|nr:hypothetical protein [Candidatus Nomurabacteria bacterium]
MKKVLIFAILVNCIIACQNPDNKISEKPKTQISKTILSSDERIDRQTKVESLQKEFKELTVMRIEYYSKANNLKAEVESLLSKMINLAEKENQLMQEYIKNLKDYNTALRVNKLISVGAEKKLKEQEFTLDKVKKELAFLDSCSKSKNNEAEDFYVKSNQFRLKADKIDEQMALLFVN